MGVNRTTYRKICTYAGNDILERITSEEYAEIRRRRNRWKLEQRKQAIAAFMGGICMNICFISLVAGWIIRGFF